PVESGLLSLVQPCSDLPPRSLIVLRPTARPLQFPSFVPLLFSLTTTPPPPLACLVRRWGSTPPPPLVRIFRLVGEDRNLDLKGRVGADGHRGWLGALADELCGQGGDHHAVIGA